MPPFPVIAGPDLTYNYHGDAFVAKVYADGSGLDYCGYIGGGSNAGPDVGYGLPEDRRGIPTDLASYPGHVFAAIDAGDNYSSILARRNHGWHEIYRGMEGKRIRAMHIHPETATSKATTKSKTAIFPIKSISINLLL